MALEPSGLVRAWRARHPDITVVLGDDFPLFQLNCQPADESWRLLNGQLDVEGATLTLLAFEPDLPAVGLNYPLAHIKPEPRAGLALPVSGP